MSVTRRSAQGRWAAVTSGVALLCALPALVAAVPAGRTGVDPSTLLARIRASATVAHSGLAESTGTLGLPDLPGLDRVSTLLGSSTRSRVWWRDPGAWRVARVTASGEEDLYPEPAGVGQWDFESATYTSVRAAAGVRLPRTDDVLPPQAARRLLSDLSDADRVLPLEAVRVAGRTAAGLRVVLADQRSSVEHVDVWADPATGLPLRVDVVGRGAQRPAFSTRFLALRFGDPGAAVVTPRRPAGATVLSTQLPDLVTVIDRFAPWRLPSRLAGLRRQRRGEVGGRGGVGVYGTGLTRFTVVPLRSYDAEHVLRHARSGGAVPVEVAGGQAVLLQSSLVAAEVATGDDVSHAYLIAGTVTPAVLTDAVDSLLANPPTQR